MNAIRGVPIVFRFEWRRSLTVPRMAWWVILAALPPVLLGLIRLNVGPPPADSQVAPLVVYVLCPGVVCMMGVFLWATPSISTELEGRSWVYLAVRPYGTWAVLLGKYLVAITWTIPAGLIASTLALLIIAQDDLSHLIWVQARLVVLASIAYAAVFTLIGVVFPKRAMVFGVFYTLAFEVLLAMIPAVVNLLTIQFRLRCLFVRWMGWEEAMVENNPVFQAYFGSQSAGWHLGILLAMTAALLVAAAVLLRWREFPASEESDL